ncbi:16S rRNA (guanine(966)-N(2))-methyltransferase RsmD [Roseimarinus sediminis]|jgi:16S rRNA (guanine(966)-N(2))-methyltransferase RsmD|uniref:16S rRNA (guanine(966)-N(2))-methyltransferase RsmD n=1 Tax=Roseimarinus sediminis TaxID=1610899 RepID=UPI003D1D67BE
MRIIGGKYKGRLFHPGKSFKARPTTDLAREGLFNILNNRIDFESIRVLDLFAGTGSIGFEFISRGCDDVTMVEVNFKHAQFIKSVLRELDEVARIYRTDVFRMIDAEKTKFDLIFADPPYDHPRFDEIPEKILEKNLLSDDGILIVEHPKEFNFSKLPAYTETRKYGKVHFSFFAKQ